MRIALPFLLILALGCSKADSSKPDVAPPKQDALAPKDPEPKLKDPDPKPKESPPPKGVAATWQPSTEINNAPALLQPYKREGKADPEKVWAKVRAEMPNDPETRELLKKLLHTPTPSIEFLDGPAPEVFRPARPLGKSPDRTLAMYVMPVKKVAVKGTDLLEFRYSAASAASPGLKRFFQDASELDALHLVINDYMLRKDLGYVLGTGTASQWEADSKNQTAAELRKKLDAEIEQHVTKNKRLN